MRLLLLLCSIIVVSSQPLLSCINQNSSVDWWFQSSFPPRVRYGDGVKGWYVTRQSLEPQMYSTDGPFSQTLERLYQLILLRQSQASANISWIFYNDQPPSMPQAPGSAAHAKGVWAWDPNTSSGFYISHSFPKFPVFNQTTPDTNPRNENKAKGQSAMCITLRTAADATFIINSLSAVKVYNYTGPFPTLLEKDEDEDAFKVRIIRDATVYFKVRAEVADIWEKAAKESEYIGSIWTWWSINNLPPMKRSDTVLARFLATPQGQCWTWAVTQDHSKFGWFQRGRDGHVLCAGGSNRAEKQTQRGGELVCVEIDHSLYNVMEGSVLVSYNEEEGLKPFYGRSQPSPFRAGGCSEYDKIIYNTGGVISKEVKETLESAKKRAAQLTEPNQQTRAANANIHKKSKR